ncbi:MAG TPA: hypothetical protein VK667_00860 [Ktedonobacteraceae bacterium]|nr:hypothetical protein [Ktedonobacteraceae bacterium]
MRHHPFQHLVLHHEAPALATQERGGGFIHVDLAANARKRDARGQTSNRAAYHRYFHHACAPGR